MIESESELAVITGDMTHHPCQLAHPDWSFADNDPKAAARTRSRLSTGPSAASQTIKSVLLQIASRIGSQTRGTLERYHRKV
jgi:hypothetical protein